MLPLTTEVKEEEGSERSKEQQEVVHLHDELLTERLSFYLNFIKYFSHSVSCCRKEKFNFLKRDVL